MFSLLLLVSLGFVQLAVGLFVLFCFGLSKSLELGPRKAVECCKQNLTGCPHRSLKDSNGERNADYRDLLKRLQREARTSLQLG